MERLIKSPNDDREYITFELKNKLRVFLINDITSNLSCVAMSLKVGYKNDIISGSAHFLEHMLFLGTSKYPDESFFHEFVKQNSGITNAYTAYDHTCYFYTIQHKSIYESLDIFSQFFVSPLLKKDSVDREINAVNSEYLKDINEDNWRTMEVLKQTCFKDHSFSRFGSGNKDTLNIPNIHLLTRKFFDNFYSSDLMTLMILTNEDLTKIKNNVEEYFSKITIKPKIHDEFRESGKIIDTPKSIYIVPVKERNELTLFWEIPIVNIKYSPTEFILNLLDCESENSVNYVLKQKGYISSFNINVRCHTDDRDIVGFNFVLSDTGLKYIDYVIQIFINYINLIKANINSNYMIQLYQEFYKMKVISFVYQEKSDHQEYILDLISRYAFNIVKPKNLLIYNIVKKKFSEIKEIMLSILDLINLDNAIIMYSSKTYNSKVTQKLKYYNAEYEITNDKPKYVEISDKLELMPLNKYIPQDFTLINDSMDKPIELINKNGILSYYMLESRLKIPITCVKVRIDIPNITKSLKTFVCGILYFDCILNQMFPDLYMCHSAGYDFTIDCVDNRLYIVIKGYSDRIKDVCEFIINFILSKNISDSVFNSVKYSMKINDTNIVYDQPYIKINDIFYKNVMKKYFNYKDRLSIIDQITKDDVINILNELLSLTFVTVLVCGNINKEKSIELTNLFSKFIIKDIYVPTIRDIDITNDFSNNKIIEKTENPNDINSAVSYFFHIDKIKFDSGNWNFNLCLINLLEKIVSEQYFDYMRTKHNFGYIVSAVSDTCGDPKCENFYFKFVVQSPSKLPEEIIEKTNRFRSKFRNTIISMKDQNFKNIVDGCISILLYPFDNITDLSEYYFKQIESQYCKFNFKEILIDTYKKINKNTLLEFYDKYIINNKNTLIISILGKK